MASRRAQGSVCMPEQRADGTWSCRIRYPAADGSRRTDYATGTTKGDALRLAQLLLAQRLREQEEIRAGVRIERAPDAPALEVLAVRASTEYLPTCQGLEQRIRTLALLRRWWLPQLGRLPVTAIDVAGVRRVLAGMRERGRSAATCNRALAALAVVLEFAKELGVVQRNVTRQARLHQAEGRKVPRYLHAGEAARVIAAADGHWRAFFAFAVYTGMRFGELAALRWRDVDLERGLVHVRGSNAADAPKNKHQRTVQMPGELRPFVGAHAEAVRAERGELHPDWLVFIGRHQGAGRSDPTSDRVAIPRKALERALRLAGVEKAVTTHDLRHTYATLMLDAGASLRDLQDALGHSSLAMVSRYVHLTGKRAEIRLNSAKPDEDE